MRVLERELFYFRFLFSLSVCFLYLSSDVVCLFAPRKCFMCRSNARGRKRETRFDFGDDVCYVVETRARAIHAMKRKRFCIYLVSFQGERMRFEFDMVVFLLRALTVFTAPQFLSVSVRRHSIRCHRPNRPLSHTQIIFIQGNP